MVSASTITDRQRRLGIRVIYINTALMYGGFFMVIPLIAAHYGNNLGWSAALIAAVLAVRQLIQQGLSLVGGVIADRLGARLPIVLGLLVRAVGFFWMAFAHTPPELFASAALAALGGAFFEAPKSAAGAALTLPEERPAFYRNLGIVGNIGMAVGPAVGGLLIRLDFAVVSIAAGAIFVVAAVLAFTMLPPLSVASRRPAHLGDGLLLALRDRRFVIYTVLAMGFWFLAVQYSLTLPFIAGEIGGTDAAVTMVLVTYSLVTIATQYPLLRFLDGRLATTSILVAGMSVMALGLGAVALVGSMIPLILCTAVYAIGAVMAQPMIQTVQARLVDPAAMGSYFAIGAYALAIGGAVGSLAGGQLYDAGESTGFSALPWLTFGVVGLVAAVGFRWFGRRWDPGDGPEAAPPAPSRDPATDRASGPAEAVRVGSRASAAVKTGP
ncbi:MAG TPA: MFS transporter [Thermomicrobiales bacterium]|jgi:DHA1 family multidrug resistance protein-like MFS transporter|nr:MFS transporter [Thermomicrobiales bacterium]